jgi:hypothetical protein
MRQSASAAAWSLAGDQQAFSWRDLMHRAGLADRLNCREQEAFRQTVKAMRDAGELRAVGMVRADHACRPMVLYTPTQPEPGSVATAELSHAVCVWSDFK